MKYSTKYSLQQAVVPQRESVYPLLMTYRVGHPNDHFLACLLSTLALVCHGMPKRLGLSPAFFSHMLNYHFPGAAWPVGLSTHGDELDVARADERKELIGLMWLHRTHEHVSVLWVAQIIAAGCMGSDHLWRDLGLWSRGDLSELMRRNFPALALKNNRDMKWKKFLYKQLCVQAGIYTCRAPSCEACMDYAACYGPQV
jgi:nitrogen fixation protein NifQ